MGGRWQAVILLALTAVLRPEAFDLRDDVALWREMREFCTCNGLPAVRDERESAAMSWRTLGNMVMAAEKLDSSSLRRRTVRAAFLGPRAWVPLRRPPRCCTHGAGAQPFTGSAGWQAIAAEEHAWDALRRDIYKEHPGSEVAYQALRNGCFYGIKRLKYFTSTRELLCRMSRPIPSGLVLATTATGLFMLEDDYMDQMEDQLQSRLPTADPPQPLRLQRGCRISATAVGNYIRWALSVAYESDALDDGGLQHHETFLEEFGLQRQLASHLWP